MYIRAAVKEILVKDNKTVGVLMEDGRQIFAEKIISNTGVLNTYKKLIPKAVFDRHNLSKQLAELDSSTAHICLYIGIKESPEKLNLGTTNYGFIFMLITIKPLLIL